MRIQDPRRILRWGVLLAALCIVPIQSSTAFAKPAPWVDYDPNGGTPSGGDGDGVVVKSAQNQPLAAARVTTTSTTTTSATRTNWSLLRNVLLAMRLGYSLRLW